MFDNSIENLIKKANMTKSEKYKNLSRGISRDMSPEAIARRLNILSELYEVAVMFRKRNKTSKDKNNNKKQQ